MTVEEEAAELLPCLNDNSMPSTATCIGNHDVDCPAYYRPAVAEQLRQRDIKNILLFHKRTSLRVENKQLHKRIAALETENERLRTELDRHGKCSAWLKPTVSDGSQTTTVAGRKTE